MSGTQPFADPLPATARMLLNRGAPVEPINQHELRFVGLQRSGHHAIINWIIANIEGSYCFLNNCPPARNPFDESLMRRDPDRTVVSNIGNLDVAAESAGFHCRKDYLIYNHEERELGTIESDSLHLNHDSWVGSSGRIYNILVLRDPYNNLASKLRMEDNRRALSKVPSSIRHLSRFAIAGLIKKPRRLIKTVAKRLKTSGTKRGDSFALAMRSVTLFKTYAREFLGDTTILPNKVLVNYNQWFADQHYRERLGKVFDLPSTHRGLDRVAKWGAGSSFDHTALDGSAQEMPVLERWKALMGDDRYRRLIDDPELQELSRRIFGGVIDFGLRQLECPEALNVVDEGASCAQTERKGGSGTARVG